MEPRFMSEGFSKQPTNQDLLLETMLKIAAKIEQEWDGVLAILADR